MSPEFLTSLNAFNPNEQALKKGEILFESGQKAFSLILALNGMIRLQKTLKEEDGEIKINEICLFRHIWGLREIISDSHFMHTAIVETPMSCKVIPGELFLEKIRADILFRVMVMEQLSKDIDSLDQGFE